MKAANAIEPVRSAVVNPPLRVGITKNCTPRSCTAFALLYAPIANMMANIPKTTAEIIHLVISHLVRITIDSKLPGPFELHDGYVRKVPHSSNRNFGQVVPFDPFLTVVTVGFAAAKRMVEPIVAFIQTRRL